MTDAKLSVDADKVDKLIDLEPMIGELACMAELASFYGTNEGRDNTIVFALARLADMSKALEKAFYAAVREEARS